jgi:hypothetical protein
MQINRRKFLSFLIAQRLGPSPPRLFVMEAFHANRGCTAVLVHHPDSASRDLFALWLRSRTHTVVRVRTPRGEEMTATIFRVRMCFGRGLVIFDTPVQIREGEVLTIIGE